jgi:hypothetical protein
MLCGSADGFGITSVTFPADADNAFFAYASLVGLAAFVMVVAA